MKHAQLIARRYAKGLMLSLKETSLDRVLGEIKILSSLYVDSDSHLQRLFEDPSFSPIDHKNVIDRISQKLDSCQITHKFLLLLASKKRMNILPEIYQSFADLCDEKKQRLRIRITSAAPVDESDIKHIADMFAKSSGKEVLVEHQIDKELIAGVKIEAAGAVFDGSLKAKLDAMKSQLLKKIA